MAERLYLGDYQSGEQALEGARKPHAEGGPPVPFSGVVSLCPMPLLDGPPLAPRYPETEWLRVPILDGGRGEGELRAVLNVIRPFTARRLRAGNVLVHCAAGMSRSVAVVAALLCERGMALDAAWAHIARAKAAALYPFVGEEAGLIAPAWEFRSHLSRIYGR